MAEITSLTTLSKASVASTDFLLVANSSTKKAKKLQAQSLFPSLSTLGTGSEGLYVSVTNSNQINLKGLKSADDTKLTVTTSSNNLVLTLVESGIDLNNCDNTTSGFLSSVSLDGTVTGTLSVLRGGTGISGITTGSVLYGSAANTISEAALTANGNILVGNTTNGYPSVGAITSTGGTITVDAATTPGNINLEVASTNSLSAVLDCNTHNINLDDAAGNSFLSGDGSSEGVHVDANGRVFIGDSTPTLPSTLGQVNLVGNSTVGISMGNTNNYGKGGTIDIANSSSGVNGMDFVIDGADCGGGNGNGGDISIGAGDGSGSGTGGDITLTAGDAASGAAGNIYLKTNNSGGTATNAISIDTNQNVSIGSGSAGFLTLNSFDTVTSAGAASVNTAVTLCDTTSGSFTVTLADGTPGQIKTFVFIVDGGDLVITPGTYTGGTSVTCADAGDTATFMYADATRKWVLLSTVGGAIS
jgi:hypothetical protein|tara:strand:+ start:9050 stop:10468 length:1419 start_codon:yes stop_codon:yes gene_type:complete